MTSDSTFTVNNNGDSNDATPGNGVCADSSGNCTLRAAIQEANATVEADEITFNFTAPTTIQITQALGELAITRSLTINGLGARVLTVRGASPAAQAVFNVNSGANPISITGITVANAATAAIHNEGTLNLLDVVIKENAIGIRSSGALNLTRSTVSNNTGGGLLLNGGSANVSNTTITNNSATIGGGINSSLQASNLTLNNVTISHNTATERGGGFAGGGNVRNVIVANNSSPTSPDVSGDFTSRGNNLIGNNSGSTGFANGVNGDKVGTAAAPVNPLLGPLQNNGGQTDTRALLNGSPARDAGNGCVVNLTCSTNNPSSALTTDQRGAGFPRSFETGVDIGAFESFYPLPSISSLVPNIWGTGRGAFELTVNGNNFVADSVVRWNGQNRATTFVSNTQLRAQILASDVQSPGQFPVTVFNLAPGGGSSNALNFTVADCSYSLNPASQSFAATGGNGSITVTTINGCAWTASSNASWITINSGGSGTGSGTVTFTVASNTGPQRTGAITIGGQTFNITQASGCTFTISPTSANVPAGSSGGTVNVTAGNGCPWTASSNASWINVTSGSSGTGNGPVQFTVTANTGPERSGTITIAGQTFTVTQASGCVYSISSTGVNISENGGTRSFNITSGAGCPWTAVSNAPWMSIVSGSGSGNGTITFSVAASGGVERSGTITAGGRTFTVNQLSMTVANLNDNGAGSLRKAIANAYDTPGDDVVRVQPSLTGTITLTSGEITINSGNGALEIRGPGANVLTISGNNASRIFYTNNANVTIADVTLSGGNGVGMGSTEGVKYGGAIYVNEGSLTLSRVHVTENYVNVLPEPGNRSVGGGVYFYFGTNHLIQNSTFSSNRCLYGAGFFSQGALTVVNSTFFGNIADAEGGAMLILGNTTLRSVTITNNQTFGVGPKGAGIYIADGLLSMVNTIIAGNTGPEISFHNGAVASAGNNLIGDAPGDSTNTNNPLTYQSSDIVDTPPRLGRLEMYGGKTPTAALLAGSPATNAGNNSNAPATDQRESARIVGETIDIGAFENNIAVSPTNPTLLNGAVGDVYIETITASRIGGNPSEPFTFSVIDGSLPPGLVLASGTGIISGVPASQGVYTFTVKATGADGMSGANRYTITIGGCAYSMNPPSQSFNASGGNGTVNVATSFGCAWTATSNASWITVNNGAGTGNGTFTYFVALNPGALRNGTITVNGQTFIITQAAATGGPPRTLYDFDGDGKADVSVYRPSNGTWYFLNSTSGFAAAQFGISTDKLAPADYDGDGKTDVAVYRDGFYYLQRSRDGFTGISFGVAGDIPTPADFDGDGKSDVAIFRPSNGTWYTSTNPAINYGAIQFGQAGDVPVAADYDGDGKSDVAIYRPSNGNWYILRSRDGFIGIPFGVPTDKPVPADYDGDGKTDIAVFRPGNGAWYLMQSTAGFAGVAFGISTDKPAPADFDGDKKADLAVFRDGTWYLLRSTQGFAGVAFGATSDKPVSGAFVP